MADSTVYILTEGCDGGYDQILAVFATEEAAELAKQYYENRITKRRGFWYEIEKKEILETSISKSEGQIFTKVGEGLDPDHLVGPAT